MKHLLLFASAVAMATACTTTPKGYTIEGTAPDSTFNGQTVYLADYAKEKRIDSTVVENGKFTFTGVIDTPSIYRIELGRNFGNVIAVNEAITVVMDKNPASVSSNGLNGQLGKYEAESTKNMNELRAAYDSLGKLYANNPDTFKVVFSKLRDELYNKNSQLTDSYFEQNKDNMLGVFCLWGQYGDYTLAQMDSIDQIVPLAKAFEPLKKIRQSKENEAKTAPGQMFVNFTGVDVAGKDVSLSDYVGKGNYVLADFWASWCGPCRGEIPNLKAINDQYKAQGLVVLGVNVWDKKDKFEKAIQEEGMTWANMFTSDNTPTQLYGINGIPQIILFAPDGTIVARDLRGDAMKAKIAEVYAKK